MPIVESLRNFPVAGMDGYSVNELTITKEAIVGNRSFAVVLESEIDRYLQDPAYIPLRMTQVRFPQLTLFKTENREGKLIIHYQDSSHLVNQTVEVEESDRAFHTSSEEIPLSHLLRERAIPFRVSKSSSSKRWAIDCGDEVANWLSKRVDKKVRLVKAVKNPESPKHHFTWYTALHAIVAESTQQLAKDTGANVDDLTFRYNVLISGIKSPYDEETWNEVMINGSKALVEACKRCGYIGIDRATGLLAQHMEVLQNVAKEHGMNFGIYIQPSGDGILTLKVGDSIEPIPSTQP
jgi:uncharacterized protein YcbX